MAYRHEYGEKYEATKGLRTVELAKLIRADIAQLITVGQLPNGLRVSLRTRTRGTLAIDAVITAAPFPILSPAYYLAFEVLPHFPRRISRFSPLAIIVVDRIKQALDAYNYDRSEPETDYYNVRFWSGVDIGSQLERAHAEALRVERADTIADLRVDFEARKAATSPGEAASSLAEHIDFAHHPVGRGLNESDWQIEKAAIGRSWAQLLTQYAPTTSAAVFTACSPRDELTAQIEALRRENAALRKRRGIASESAHV